MKQQRKSRAKISTPYPTSGNASKRHTADFLGISDATLNRWEKAGKIPKSFELEKGFPVFDAAEIRSWVDAKKAQREGI